MEEEEEGEQLVLVLAEQAEARSDRSRAAPPSPLLVERIHSHTHPTTSRAAWPEEATSVPVPATVVLLRVHLHPNCAHRAVVVLLPQLRLRCPCLTSTRICAAATTT